MRHCVIDAFFAHCFSFEPGMAASCAATPMRNACAICRDARMVVLRRRSVIKQRDLHSPAWQVWSVFLAEASCVYGAPTSYSEITRGQYLPSNCIGGASASAGRGGTDAAAEVSPLVLILFLLFMGAYALWPSDCPFNGWEVSIVLCDQCQRFMHPLRKQWCKMTRKPIGCASVDLSW